MTVVENADAAASGDQLAEVWGDVVSRSQLGKAVLISALSSVSVYLLALETVAPLAGTAYIGKAMAMLAGIAGALSAGAICAFLFPPKRVVLSRAVSASAWQSRVLEQLEQDEGPLGSVSELSPDVVDEMRAAELYDVFDAFERARRPDQGAA